MYVFDKWIKNVKGELINMTWAWDKEKKIWGLQLTRDLPKILVGALTAKLWELMESKVI